MNYTWTGAAHGTARTLSFSLQPKPININKKYRFGDILGLENEGGALSSFKADR